MMTLAMRVIVQRGRGREKGLMMKLLRDGEKKDYGKNKGSFTVKQIYLAVTKFWRYSLFMQKER